MDRRTFIGTTGVLGATALAGCGGQGGTEASGTTDGSGSDAGMTTGRFRLLVSDRPADIGDFDSLDVTFDSARVFRAAESDEETATATASGTETATSESTATDSETADPDDGPDGDDTDEGDGGFTVFDLDSPTVDLTRVVGEAAIGVLDGELEPGRYTKVELNVSAVEGVVDGESVAVKVPSEKLQITKPFEVVAGETVSFVFDINVVKKGPNGYNLLPVISESGIAGRDVEVEEVDSDEPTEPTATETVDGTETEA